VDDESLVALPNVLLRAEVHTRAAHRFRRRVRHLNAGGRPGPVYDPARAMKKGIWAGCFRADLPLEGRFALARAAGFDGIELTADDALLGDESRLRGLAELARRTVPVCSLMCGGARKLGSPDEGERRAAVEHVRRAITAATVLGTDTLLVIPAYVDAQVTYEQAWERGQAGLRALLPAAEEHGVTLAVENVWNRFLLSPLEMARFVDDVGSASVRAYFDVGNVLLFGYPDQWIRTLAGRLARVHLKDFRRAVGTLAGFVPLGDGDADWPAVIAALRAVGYDGWVTSETDPVRALPDGGVRDLARRIDGLVAL
jgi:L-ribulose-5-phosphate 3-epimerase